MHGKDMKSPSPVRYAQVELSPKELQNNKTQKIDPQIAGNPARKKPEMRRSNAVIYDDDPEALKKLEKSQFVVK